MEDEDDLQCIMCNNKTLKDFLKKHIRFHHMIDKLELVEKLYNMHFEQEKVDMETQTIVSWDDLKKNDNEDKTERSLSLDNNCSLESVNITRQHDHPEVELNGKVFEEEATSDNDATSDNVAIDCDDIAPPSPLCHLSDTEAEVNTEACHSEITARELVESVVKMAEEQGSRTDIKELEEKEVTACATPANTS